MEDLNAVLAQIAQRAKNVKVRFKPLLSIYVCKPQQVHAIVENRQILHLLRKDYGTKE